MHEIINQCKSRRDQNSCVKHRTVAVPSDRRCTAATPRTASRPRPRRCTALLDAVAAPIAKLGGDNIVTNIPASYGPISLEKGECLTALPLKDGTWYNLHYRIENTFKEDGLWDHHDLGAKMRQIDHKRLLALRKKA